MTAKRRGGIWLIVVGLAGPGAHSVALGQGNDFNPYGNSGYADYREFTTPIYSGDPSMPGQARLQGGLYGRSQANQFQSYVNSLDSSSGANQTNSRASTTGVPYYLSNRATSRDEKGYRPNDTPADRLFRERKSQRDAAYNKALEEKDPRKRAYLMQQIDRDSLDRPLSATTRKLAAQAKADEGDKPAPARQAGAKPVARGATTPATRGTTPAAATRRPAGTATTPAARATATPAPEPAAFAPTPPTAATIPITPPR